MEYVALGIVVVVLAAFLLLGWLLPLVLGIVRIRRKGAGGVVLTVIGGVWGLVVLGVVGLAVYEVHEYSRVSDSGKVVDFDPAQYQGQTGSIVLSHKGESTLEIGGRDGGGRMRLSTSNGVLSAPVGTYNLFSYEAVGKDESGATWVASGSLSSRGREPISVKANSTQTLELGPPFKASVTVKSTGRGSATLDMSLKGCDGNQYTISKKGGRGEPPSFQVLSKTGEVLWQGRFEYG